MNFDKRIQISRRSFLRRSSLIATATGLPLWFVEREVALAADPAPTPSANDRPNVALIGCGGMGTGDAQNAKRLCNIVAVCDVDGNHRDRAVQALSDPGRKTDAFSDFRKVLERDDIDAIINGTPDHWHSLINIGAAIAGKDIYSEKPLTLTIDEGKQVVRAVQQHKVILQTGTQQRSTQRFRLACEMVRNGRIGKLKEVTVWLPAGRRGGPFPSAPVPEGLDWDFWLGQAPKVDYVPERCHMNFRNWYDYSGGTMTDWGAHHMDIGYWAIGLPAPTHIEGKALTQPVPGGFTAISDYEVRFTYPNGVIFNVRTTPDDSPFGETINPDGQRNGIRFEGSDGWIWVNRGSLDASDLDLLRKPLPDDAERLYVSNDHMKNFFDCMVSRKDPIADVVTGHLSATVCHLGAIALRTGKALEWDPEKQSFTGENAAIALPFMAREMRKPYDYSMVGWS
ncbi:MAG: Gfo/Idh/MocA family oxidoreductase [Akkermansiaceae bacterium]|jgi:predicted dehydrogenase|nr:Gfo/Idh/MocA family oxidoreductase [Akkermansiaceae bacterium]